ncbi:hypothetical protein EUTSA_v10017503mg [Eutrema salsugineum]|uniref:Uncharacterized protein n=1 Tax=Eutrema salsugineum TaxID=72664 RepID=V4M675_EUTSA|nr:hypothetical protein EUTSA_v10017503mg [Eutrema salsugineum]
MFSQEARKLLLFFYDFIFFWFGVALLYPLRFTLVYRLGWDSYNTCCTLFFGQIIHGVLNIVYVIETEVL